MKIKSKLESHLQSLPERLQVPVAHQLDRLFEDSDSVAWLDRAEPELLASICKVWACSEFVSRYCVTHSDVFKDLVESGDLQRAYASGELPAKISHLLQTVDDQPQLNVVIRYARQREMVRIAWRDISGWAQLSETLEDLSQLADTCVALALEKLQHWLEQSFGQPSDSKGRTQQLVVLAMGKLGAHELNFSSDVDLIFAYPHSGQTLNGPKSISNEEFFTRLGRQFITVLDQVTAEGFVFRVDMRLRPFGESGPLVTSFDAFESYYQIHGREWERYAMIKARAITGGEQGERLLQMLRPFIYRRYLDFGTYDALRDMKNRIETEIKRKSMADNVKLGPGGIREVEFVGQAFQLIRGGREPELQQRQILSILAVLGEKQMLPEFVVKELDTGYRFLRTVENRLQQFADQQTHLLPKEEIGKLRLAYAMGFTDWPGFEKALNLHRKRVQNHFQQVFAAPQTEHASTEKHGFSDVWLGILDESHAIAVLQEAGFVDAKQAWDYLRACHDSSAYSALSNQGKQRMDRLMPLLLGAVAQSDRPDQVLKRLLDLVQAIARRTSYLALLVENPMALSQLVKLCAASPWISHHIARQPILLDELLDPRSLYAPPKRDQLEVELRHRMAHIAVDDLEQQMDLLRQFKNANVLRVAAADVFEAVPLMVVSDHLTYIAETVVNKVLELVWQQMVARHGKPTHADADAQHCGFAVIAYGKLGGIELGYGSDLDLVFIYSGDQNGFTDGAKSVANSVFYSRLGQRIIHIFTAITPAGVLYEVDMRLRPSGASGLLVTHVDSFEDYQLNKAWTWEHQALVRARPVAGDSAVGRKFERIRQRVLAQPRDPQTVRREVSEMRERMRKELLPANQTQFDLKQGLGGITDIEFMVQYAVLVYAAEYPELLTYTDNIRILETMMAKGLISQEDGAALIDCYKILRGQIHRLTLQEQATTTADDYYGQIGRKVHHQWRKVMGQVQER
ncbi:MAG: bifunctional [glutamate--ammonia ligase]-adenylyl-L-tyrosine phosphorylase/[glutamate--ammonia-ligase] adenylyltransferase [Gammaproteobacteria bacterium]